MLKFNNNGNVCYNVLASWYGGFTRGNSWKLNSGVNRVEEDKNYYYFYGASGSVYQCHKKTYGMSAYTMGILNQFYQDAKSAEGVTIELLQEDTNFITLPY